RAREKLKRDLTRARLVRVSYRLQHLASLAARRRKFIMAARRIGPDGNAVLLAPRDHGVLDRAFLQVVEHLIASDVALARDIEQLVEIISVEIADAPGADFSGSNQFVERRDCLLHGIGVALIQHATID